jgi:putative glutamine amidotransferase
MPRPFIGITSGTSALDKHATNPQDRLNQTYSRAVEAAGGVPIILPNIDAAAQELVSRLDGLLLSGGYDLAPTLFDEGVLNETVEIDEGRDRAEMPILRAALERDMPILAICRGIQTLNVALGGSLYQDIPAQIPSDIQHKQKQPRHEATHTIAIERDSRLAAAVGGAEMPVNSFHHQALKRVGEGLRVTAVAPDGVIEAVEGTDGRFLLGVQFHPEEMVGVSEQAKAIFQAFVLAASHQS